MYKKNKSITSCYLCGDIIWQRLGKDLKGSYYVNEEKDKRGHKLTCIWGKFVEEEQKLSGHKYFSIPHNPKQPGVFGPINKLCQICWNSNGWKKPSGKPKVSYFNERNFKQGFGFEEWIFDFTKKINGYHYSYVEPLNENYRKYKEYVNTPLNLVLYTYHNNKFYLIGRLKNVEVINKIESSKIVEHYVKEKWVEEMKREVRNLNPQTQLSEDWLIENLTFNIKFRPEDIEEINEFLVPINEIEIKYYGFPLLFNYNLLDIDDKKYDRLNLKSKNFNFDSGSDEFDKLASSAIKTFKENEIELELKHNQIVAAFFKYLKIDLGYTVKRECLVYDDKRVDITQETNNGRIFYEIKTYNHLKTSLRIALGQLLEYSCYPENRFAEKLYLVSDLKPTDEFKKYLKHLKTIFNIPIGYIQFDLTENKIVNQIN